MPSSGGCASFSLIELLIVIAVIAVLATVVILVLNPAAMLQRARDSNRLSDMKTIDEAISLYQEDTGGSLGVSSTLYLSIPDPDATSTQGDQCQGLGLSTSSLPSGWTYHCAASSTNKDVNGTGWLPLDFTKLSTGSPLSVLPVDPINQASSNLYYTYVDSGDLYEITALFESSKYAATMADDGGPDPSAYEAGTSLTLSPFARGLVGYWTFDEGSGVTVHDSSGMGNDGTWGGTAVGTSGYYSAGHNQTWAGMFDGSTDEVVFDSTVRNAIPLSVSLWMNISEFPTASTLRDLIRTGHDGSNGWYLDFWGGGGALRLGLDGSQYIGYPMSNLSTGRWYFVIGTVDSLGGMTLYVNGVPVSSGSAAGYYSASSNVQIGHSIAYGRYLDGFIQDVRIYNRALSASEIQAIYNAEK